MIIIINYYILLSKEISILLILTELFFPESHLTSSSRHPDAAETNHRVGALLAHFPGCGGVGWLRWIDNWDGYPRHSRKL